MTAKGGQPTGDAICMLLQRNFRHVVGGVINVGAALRCGFVKAVVSRFLCLRYDLDFVAVEGQFFLSPSGVPRAPTAERVELGLPIVVRRPQPAPLPSFEPLELSTAARDC